MVGPPCATSVGIYPQSSWEPLKGFELPMPGKELVWLRAEHRRGQVERRHALERLMELERWVDPSHMGGEVARTLCVGHG